MTSPLPVNVAALLPCYDTLKHVSLPHEEQTHCAYLLQAIYHCYIPPCSLHL